MSYNHTYAQIKDILKSNPKITKDVMLQVAQLAIIETMGSELPEGTEIKWDSKLGDDLMLDSLSMVELVMFLEECFSIEIPDEEAGSIVTVGDACAVIKKCKANKGKIKKINVDKYKNKQTPVPHPDSPLMSKKPLENLTKTDYETLDKEIDKALEENADTKELS
jgi:acyl carrier protein|tara:strand:+ start:28 stop:522 length:495 start_codon:yes stop_codon:yes gene_type:complete